MSETDTPSLNYLAGTEAVSVIKRIYPAPDDNAKAFHDAIAEALSSAKFNIQREYRIQSRESGRGRGQIDILAEKYGGIVALELDRRVPRAGSMDKLRAIDAFRVVVLRGAAPWPQERDIDAIFSIAVCQLAHA